jgi:hypothetical protein
MSLDAGGRVRHAILMIHAKSGRFCEMATGSAEYKPPGAVSPPTAPASEINGR